MLSEMEPTTIRFPGIEGTAYSILNIQGHIVMLTSAALYVFANLAARFLEGHPIEREPTLVINFSMEAVDINGFRGSEFFVILPEQVEVFDVNQLLLMPKHSQSVPEQHANGKWQCGSVATHQEAFAIPDGATGYSNALYSAVV